MRKTKNWKPSATVITACSAFSAVCVLGAACHFDALLGSGRKGGGGGGGGGGRRERPRIGYAAAQRYENPDPHRRVHARADHRRTGRGARYHRRNAPR